MTRISSLLDWTRWALLVETGWCGFGASGGLMPELRLGLLRLVGVRGSIVGRIAEWEAAMIAAKRDLLNQKQG